MSTAEVQDGTHVHVCKLDEKEDSAGKKWVVVHSLWLLCGVAGCRLAQCDLPVIEH